ncbi:hypothetical protein BD626DRAFT_561028 [Schizophyllum amplum]|uniref:Aminoglycoside phosphotransferase domain-containing protein n=1 Tax=Schizophyllum amplum TaxID=97359 RepID=A0A550BTQ2_9AGAR|nr:hypothetical protein BD626DRAFT_561028 [Auriculariopsis ampla]
MSDARCPYFSSPSHRSIHLPVAQYNEQDLFSMTTYRWLYNNDQQLVLRHVPFNVKALIDLAVRSAEATGCVSFEKIHEGTMNRMFALRLDNDVEYVVKIPFSVAGPKHLCTASEVATLDYLRTELEFPVPVVRAWCSHAETSPVGTEFIMYERLPGTPLSKYDNNDLSLKDDPYIRILPIVRVIESSMTLMGFSQIGSLYYKEDVAEHLRDRPLYSNQQNATANSERFRIGPTVDREFWRAGRSSLHIDRGPWFDDRAYLVALGACARASVEAGLEPDPDGTDGRLISTYDELVPQMSPLRTSCTLWHPDLRADNFIVDGLGIEAADDNADSSGLSGIINWQGSTITPYYLQYAVPPAYELTASDKALVQYSADGKPSLANGYEDSGEENKATAKRALRRAWRAYVHEAVLRKVDARLAGDLYGVRGANALRVACSPVSCITRGAHSLGVIGQSIAAVYRLWNAMVGADNNGKPLAAFPDILTDEDGIRIEEQDTRAEHVASLGKDELARLGIRLEDEGLVSAHKYNEAMETIEGARQAALAAASPSEERQRVARDWPFQDGKAARSAERCW